MADCSLDNFLPLNVTRTSKLGKEYYRAVYALSLDEAEFQHFFLSKVINAVCQHVLPSVLPASPDIARVRFEYIEDLDARGGAHRGRLALAAVKVYNADERDLPVSTTFTTSSYIDDNFTDDFRNSLVLKYQFLSTLFQHSQSTQRIFFNSTTSPFYHKVRLKHTSCAISMTDFIEISFQKINTIADLVEAFFVDNIPFDGFPTES